VVDKHLRVGLAGWSNPPAHRTRRSDQTHLAYYAEHFDCVEINSSFYRPHLGKTYAKWRDETPARFLFSAKMPRSVTHEARLRDCASEVSRFYDEVSNLQPKLGVILVQLPPSLEYSAAAARSFFKNLPSLSKTMVACEPRHASWFTQAADEALKRSNIARVAADPAKFPSAEVPGGQDHVAYFRWHGSPQMYYSDYTKQQLTNFANQVHNTKAQNVWCVFDNTARYAAWDNAQSLVKLAQSIDARQPSSCKPRDA
jgi:uncharacterized protein YecE (DUF72 family)